MSTLLLVRHGQSEWNAAGRWQGHADPPLTELGRRQAALAAGALGAVDAIVASDLVRARETAEVIAEALGVGPVVVDAAFRERHAGEWQGLTRHEIHHAWPGFLRDDPAHGEQRPSTDRFPPGWEPDESLIERSLHGFARVAHLAAGGSALVVSHGGVIAAWERHLRSPWKGPIANLSGRWFTVDPTGGPAIGLGERVALLPGAASTTPQQP